MYAWKHAPDSADGDALTHMQQATLESILLEYSDRNVHLVLRITYARDATIDTKHVKQH